MIEEKNDVQAQVEGLATLLVLDDEIRRLTNLREFAFFSVNETHRLIPYHTAYLWQKKEFIGTHLIMQSGAAELDINAPANLWIKELISFTLEKSSEKNKIHAIDPTKNEIDELKSDWPENLPTHLLWCPFLDKNKKITGGLIFFREENFTPPEIKMLSWLISSYQYAWTSLNRPGHISTLQKLKSKPYLIGLGFILLIIILFPVHLTVLGTATVIPLNPVLINAPMQGIIKTIWVNPGDKITKGQVLLSMDKSDLQANVDVDEKNLLLTKTKLRAVINETFTNKGSHEDEPILQSQVAIDQANIDYTNNLLQRADVKSPIDGIVIFDNKEDWLGQPVRTGERILVVADPKYVALKITIPVSENILLEKGDNGEFFTYGALNPIPVKITILGYNAIFMPNKILSYQLKAKFVDLSEAPQIGTQGTVKLYGKHVPFIYYLLRRPLQTMRITLGL